MPDWTCRNNQETTPTNSVAALPLTKLTLLPPGSLHDDYPPHTITLKLFFFCSVPLVARMPYVTTTSLESGPHWPLGLIPRSLFHESLTQCWRLRGTTILGFVLRERGRSEWGEFVRILDHHQDSVSLAKLLVVPAADYPIAHTSFPTVPNPLFPTYSCFGASPMPTALIPFLPASTRLTVTQPSIVDIWTQILL